MNTNIAAFEPKAGPAADRLAGSRARIRDWMQGTDDQHDGPARERSDGSSWLDVLGEIPIVGSIVLGVRTVLRDSPISATAQLAEQAGNEALRPIAEEHPLALVGIAAATGALLWWAKPWRTVLRSALFAGMLSQLGARLMTHVPLASVFDALHSAGGRPARARPDDRHSPESQEGIRHSG